VVNDVAPADRDIAMVFQNYALYPHMSNRENLAFGLRMRKMDDKEIQRRIEKWPRSLSLEHLLDRRPRELSGGQRQRIALGRAIVRDPQGVPVRRAPLQPGRQTACADAHRDRPAAQAPSPPWST
jgi:ABC-type sugar transport system ATPase subunit